MSVDAAPKALRGSRERILAGMDRAASRLLRSSRRWVGKHGRRAFDLALGGTGLLVSSPVLLAAAAAVKLTSDGPIFFRQVRVGRGGQPLVIYKIRSMYTNAEARLEELRHLNESRGDVTFKIKRDPRITPVGRVIRKFSIDELPQLWNVVAGSMSVFGPRPPTPNEVARYGPLQRRRLEVTPGLTCFWQVEGRSDLSFEEQVNLDIAYIDNSTAADELRILLRTIPAVLTGKGAY